MRGLEVTDEGLEVLGDELGSIVGNNTRPETGISFVGTLQDDLGVGFLHGGANVPGKNGSGAAVEDRAEIVEGAGKVNVGEVDMPVVMGLDGLNEAIAFPGRLGVPGLKQTSVLEHAIGGRRTHRDAIAIEHHEGQAAITFERVLASKVDDGLAFV